MAPATGLLLSFTYVLLVNGVAFLAFGVDKRRAQLGEWRTPETRLLFLALCGGWIGAKLGQCVYRHKTRKQPFAFMLNSVVAV